MHANIPHTQVGYDVAHVLMEPQLTQRDVKAVARLLRRLGRNPLFQSGGMHLSTAAVTNYVEEIAANLERAERRTAGNAWLTPLLDDMRNITACLTESAIDPENRPMSLLEAVWLGSYLANMSVYSQVLAYRCKSDLPYALWDNGLHGVEPVGQSATTTAPI